MVGASPDSASRLRGTILSRGMVLAFGLLATTSCATIRDYLVPSNHTLPRAEAPRETDREPPSRVNELCIGPTLPGTNRLHVVLAGETLSEIAVHYRVLVSELHALNSILDPDRIEVGQRLFLPSDAVVPSRALIPRRSRPAPTRAQALMAEAEAHYQAAQFERALALSQEARALMEDESNRSKQLAHAAFLAGSALAGLGDEQRASEEFDRVHALDAHFEPPDGWLSPRLGILYGETFPK